MKRSAHAKRMARRHARNQVAKLNLVSLMDIFTILVFFLLLNSGDVEVLHPGKDLKLPDSTSDERPSVALVVNITGDSIVVGSSPAIAIDELEQDQIQQQLLSLLEKEANKRSLLIDEMPEQGWPITLMGDRSVSYDVLSLVMDTCAQTDYRDIALAVNKVQSSAEGAAGG